MFPTQLQTSPYEIQLRKYRPVKDITIPICDLPSVLTRYSKNSLNDIGTAPKNITNAYGITCSIKRSLLPKKIQIGFKNRIPPIVNTRESMSSTIAIKVKISFASCSRFCPIFSPMMAADPVANMTAVPKIIQVIGITILIPARASEPA